MCNQGERRGKMKVEINPGYLWDADTGKWSSPTLEKHVRKKAPVCQPALQRDA